MNIRVKDMVYYLSFVFSIVYSVQCDIILIFKN